MKVQAVLLSCTKGFTDMADDEKNNSDTYQIRGLSAQPEITITPVGDSDIFAVKKENLDRLGFTIGMTLGEGVFLCNAYRLDKRISRNEMGETWQASDLRTSQNVIVYLPPPEIRKAESTLEPVRKNARHVEALDHPRIVPVLENFTDPEHGFFTVRKFVKGKTLDVYRKEYIQKHKTFAPPKVVKLVKVIAHAVDYAHGVDIIHGDLCPKSIIISPNDEVYVDNFALMPVQAEKASAERIPYLPPEVADGNSAIAASDVYALAIIVYELLAGRLPLLPESMDSPLPIPHVPDTVDAVIRKAMSKRPDDRYDSCGTFVKALESCFLEPKRIKSAIVSSSLSSGKKTVSLVRWAGRALVCCLLIVGGIILGLKQLPQTSETQTESREPRVLPSPDGTEGESETPLTDISFESDEKTDEQFFEVPTP